MRSVKHATINQRITAGMKAALVRIAHKKHTSEAEIVRQALVKYLVGLGATEEELHRISSAANEEALRLAEMLGEDLPERPVAKPKASRRGKRRGT